MNEPMDPDDLIAPLTLDLMTELLTENTRLRGLVLSMALRIPKDQMPTGERELLDEILTGVV